MFFFFLNDTWSPRMKQSDTGLGCGSVIYSKPLQFPEPVLSFNLLCLLSNATVKHHIIKFQKQQQPCSQHFTYIISIGHHKTIIKQVPLLQQMKKLRLREATGLAQSQLMGGRAQLITQAGLYLQYIWMALETRHWGKK